MHEDLVRALHGQVLGEGELVPWRRRRHPRLGPHWGLVRADLGGRTGGSHGLGPGLGRAEAGLANIFPGQVDRRAGLGQLGLCLHVGVRQPARGHPVPGLLPGQGQLHLQPRPVTRRVLRHGEVVAGHQVEAAANIHLPTSGCSCRGLLQAAEVEVRSRHHHGAAAQLDGDAGGRQEPGEGVAARPHLRRGLLGLEVCLEAREHLGGDVHPQQVVLPVEGVRVDRAGLRRQLQVLRPAQAQAEAECLPGLGLGPDEEVSPAPILAPLYQCRDEAVRCLLFSLLCNQSLPFNNEVLADCPDTWVRVVFLQVRDSASNASFLP